MNDGNCEGFLTFYSSLSFITLRFEYINLIHTKINSVKQLMFSAMMIKCMLNRKLQRTDTNCDGNPNQVWN